MINLLKKFFEKDDKSISKNDNENLEIICGLMVEAAYSDGVLEKLEEDRIKSILVNIFQEDEMNVNAVLDKCVKNKNNSNSLYFYTSRINKNYSESKKILLVETLWEIILSDGNVHEYESSLIRRISGLLYISDVNSGNAKKRALSNLGINQ